MRKTISKFPSERNGAISIISSKKFNNKSLNLMSIVNITRELCSYKLSGITTNSTSKTKKHELQIYYTYIKLFWKSNFKEANFLSIDLGPCHF